MKTRDDILIRGMLKNENIRFSFIETTSTVTKAILLHDIDPLSSLLYGRALTTAGLTAILLNNREKYSLTWSYNGQLSSIVTDVNANCDIRGITKTPHLLETVCEESDIYGSEGKISLIKSEEGKILNSGVIDAGLLDISDDVALFFCISDQIETEITTQIKFNTNIEAPIAISSGFMIQAMPDCDLLKFEKYRAQLKSIEFNELLIDKTLPIDDKISHLINKLDPSYSSGENSLMVYKKENSPSYKCNCSYEKMKMSLNVLDRDDLKNLLKEQGAIKIKCEYCNRSYEFDSV